jgi:hypothetical protein
MNTRVFVCLFVIATLDRYVLDIPITFMLYPYVRKRESTYEDESCCTIDNSTLLVC